MAGRVPKGLTIKRREIVGRLFLRGLPMREIAEHLRDYGLIKYKLYGVDRVTHVTVYRDVKACLSKWEAQSDRSLDKARAQQVARLLELLRQAWEDCGNVKKISTLKTQYMNVIINTERQLSKILGTEAPTRVSGADGGVLFPREINLILADGTPIISPRNGLGEEVYIDGNGHKDGA